MKLFYIMYESKLIKFYVHNYAILYSEIFYKRFYDFSSHTILAVILRFLYGHIRVRSFYDFTIRSYDPIFRSPFRFVSRSRFWLPCQKSYSSYQLQVIYERYLISCLTINFGIRSKKVITTSLLKFLFKKAAFVVDQSFSSSYFHLL